MKEIIILTKEEIGDAIINYIALFVKGKTFFPYRIHQTDPPLKLPETVNFHLEFIPKGTSASKAKNKI